MAATITPHGAMNEPCELWLSEIDRVLYTTDEIQSRVVELGKEISEYYNNLDGGELIVVGMLKGAFVFLADLVRNISHPNAVDFMTVSSYHGTQSSGNVKLKKDMAIDPYDKHVLIVEDLIDTGTTLNWLVNHLTSKSCRSVRLCCLLDKVAGRTAGVGPNIDFVGYTMETNDYVIGYGMDFYEQKYRSLPYIAVPTEAAIAAHCS